MAATEQTEKLIEEMLGFLESSSDEDNDEEDADIEINKNAALADEDEHLEVDEDDELYESAKDEQCSELTNSVARPIKTIRKKREKRAKQSIAKEIKKIKNSFPIWNTKEIAPTAKRLVDPIWQQAYGSDAKYAQAEYENDWNAKLESNCRRSSNSYVQEVNRAIYGDTAGHPTNGSNDYFQAAQNYAIYGKDFLDFPENLTPLLAEKNVGGQVDATVPQFAAATSTVYGNGLYPTPAATAAPTENTMAGVNFANFGKQLAAAGASTAAYYQMCNGMQPSVRPAAASAAPAGSTAYGMFLGNKVTYVAAAAPQSAPPPLVYNQHSATTTNFISNSLANAALATSPAILYSNPMLTTTTQQYLNTFFKETQYLSGGTTQGTVTGTTTGIYERLVYAQMLQQQIYHQTQQQAAAVAAMFQHKQRPRSNVAAAAAATAAGISSAAQPMNGGGGVGGGASIAAAALNLCGRQAAMASANASELLSKNVSANGGNEELLSTAASIE